MKKAIKRILPEPMKKVIGQSIFRCLRDGTSINDILAILFHRTAASMYAIYALWALSSIFIGLPSVEMIIGRPGQQIFSAILLVTAIPACFGATFWPNFARLELVAGSGFTMAVIVYMFFLGSKVLSGEGLLTSFIIYWSLLVIPLARTVIVILFLLRQAKEIKLTEAEGTS